MAVRRIDCECSSAVHVRQGGERKLQGVHVPMLMSFLPLAGVFCFCSLFLVFLLWYYKKHGAQRHKVTAGGGALAHAGPWCLALWGCPRAIGRQLLVLSGQFLRLKVHMSSLPHLGYPHCSHDISVILLSHLLKLTCVPGLGCCHRTLCIFAVAVFLQRRNPGQTPLLLTPLYLPPMIIISWPNIPSAWFSFLFWPFLQSGSSFVGETIQPPFPHSTLLKL